MGWGVSKLIKLVELGEQQGVDGIEPNATEVKNVWAQVSIVSQSRGFDNNKTQYKNAYQFLIRVDSSLYISQQIMLEFDNRRFSMQSVERGNIIKNSGKFNYQFRLADNGAYWRIISTAEDIS